MVVPAKWSGTNADKHDMEKLQLDQVLRRNFGRTAIFGFASNLICSWELLLCSLSLSLLNGGTAGFFWNTVISIIGLIAVYCSVAELGSVIPTSGGQYYWVAILAPKSCQRYLSYITGWLCAMAWETGVAAGCFLAGTIIQGLFILNIPSYTPHMWHGTLLAISVACLAIFINVTLAKKLPLIEGVLVILHVLGIVLMVPLWVLSPIRNDGGIFTEYFNGGGWSSTGVSAMVGILPVVLCFTGLDCSVHMAEETKDSSRSLPISLLASYVINASLGFFVVMTVIFTAGPIDQLLQSPTGYAFIDIFYNATKSKAATTFMTSIIIINVTASSVATLTTSSRQLWSFARNKGVPFSSFFAPEELTGYIPKNALFVSLGIAVGLSLINIGSNVALNAIFSLCTGSLITSYIITISCTIAWRLRANPFPRGRYSLGRWGLLVNILAVAFLLPVYVFSFFPSVANPTPQTMNWGSLMYSVILMFATIYYAIYGRHSYTPPNEQVKQLIVGHDRFYVSSDVSEPELERERVEVMGKKHLDEKHLDEKHLGNGVGS